MWKQHNNKMIFIRLHLPETFYTLFASISSDYFHFQYTAIKSDYFLFVLTQKVTWEGTLNNGLLLVSSQTIACTRLYILLEAFYFN